MKSEVLSIELSPDKTKYAMYMVWDASIADHHAAFVTTCGSCGLDWFGMVATFDASTHAMLAQVVFYNDLNAWHRD